MNTAIIAALFRVFCIEKHPELVLDCLSGDVLGILVKDATIQYEFIWWLKSNPYELDREHLRNILDFNVVAEG